MRNARQTWKAMFSAYAVCLLTLAVKEQLRTILKIKHE